MLINLDRSSLLTAENILIIVMIVMIHNQPNGRTLQAGSPLIHQTRDRAPPIRIRRLGESRASIQVTRIR